MIAVLLVVSAGCTTLAPGSGSSTTPATAAGGIIPGTPALPAGTLSGNTPAEGQNGSMQVAEIGDIVAVYYTGLFENGTVFDSNMNATTPVVFALGNSSVIQGFNEAVTGMSVNQEKTVFIPADKAYGEYNASLIRTVNRTGPIANTTFTEGQFYSIHDRKTNSISVVRILNVTPTTVTWDANDPLAGQNFTFTIKLVQISRP